MNKKYLNLFGPKVKDSVPERLSAWMLKSAGQRNGREPAHYVAWLEVDAATLDVIHSKLMNGGYRYIRYSLNHIGRLGAFKGVMIKEGDVEFGYVAAVIKPCRRADPDLYRGVEEIALSLPRGRSGPQY